MLAEMLREFNHLFIWSNEKIFTVKAVTNTQNDRLPEDSRTHLRRMKPAGWIQVPFSLHGGECLGEHASLYQDVDTHSVNQNH